MASPSSGTGSAGVNDVYISYARAETAWARRLAQDLSEQGIRCFFDPELTADVTWAEALQQGLDGSGALVVLWSAEARRSKEIRTELARFVTRSGETGERRPIVPLILGDADLLRTAPRELASRQPVIVGRDTYAAGPETDLAQWHDAVREIAQLLEPNVRLRQFRETARRSRTSAVEAEVPGEAPAGEALGAQAEVPLPSFSRAALRALSFAAEMVGENAEPIRLRTAALLGSLRASAVSGMGPTTGDVVKLVLAHQTGRDALQTLAAAADAAGLKPVEEPESGTMTVEALIGSSVRQLVEDAIAVHRQVDADGVHLHHVLATGVDPAVSADALAELGITLSELREHWRASIRGRWPDESSAAWDKILARPAPPSARVDHRPALRLPGFAADAPEGVDLLGVRSRVDFLSSVLAARHLETPLAIGLFGDWGSGKSFFMRRLQERIRLLTERSAQAEEQGEKTLYCSHARQVTFNAWLYADSDIWPSFAAQVFRSVTGAAEDVPSGQIQAGHLSEYQEEVQSLEATRSEAEREEAVLDRRLTELDAEIEAKRVEIQTRAGAIGPEAGAAAKLVADLAEISHRLLSLVRNWRSIRASDLVMLAVPVAVGVSAVFFDWARILAVLAVVSGFVALVLSSLRYVERTRALRQEIAALARQKQQLQAERQDRARRRATAELSLGEAAELPLLPQFAEEQAARWLGRRQLGVVTEIRLAFERLSKMIDESRAAGRPTAGARGKGVPIDRVIIYVDDLDRCPHDVVVRVLETIKVLLDLRHFVVVVGVDSRWLFRSIQVHFSELLHPEARSDDDAAWAATPQNYLEKIFQYSIVLRPIDATGFERLIGSLLRVEDEVAEGAAGEPLPGTVADEPTDAPPEVRKASLEPAAPEVSERLGTDSTASQAGTPAPEFDLTPGDLVITRDELDFMRRLAPLFATPRAAKRLVNIYRLLRVSAGAERLESRKTYEYALVLLSLTTAFPALAGDVFRMIARKTQEDWSALLDSLQPRPSDPPGRIENEVSSELSPSEAAAWAKLVGALRTIRWADPEGPPLGALHEWTAIVAEYSFHPWQDLLPADTRG